LKNLFLKLKNLFLRLFSKTTEPVALPNVASSNINDAGEKIPLILLGTIRAFNPEKEMILKGCKMLNIVLASDLFKQKFLAASMTETKGMSNAKIYMLFCQSSILVDVNVFTGNVKQNYLSKTMGYETVPGVVNINRFFISQAVDYGNVLIHEIGHSIGFSHFLRGMKQSSVSYTLNKIYLECVKELKLV
jgi:hypothetical protein